MSNIWKEQELEVSALKEQITDLKDKIDRMQQYETQGELVSMILEAEKALKWHREYERDLVMRLERAEAKNEI